MSLKSYIEFIGGVCRNPKQFSTLAPTGRYLSTKLLRHSNINHSKNILELGCGSGAITKEIVTTMPTGSHYWGIEFDTKLTAFLQKKYPQHHFKSGSAANITKLFPQTKFDTIISSLPWTMFDHKTKKKVLHEINSSLNKEGHFLLFITKHVDKTQSANELKDLIKALNLKLQKVESIWLNLPPANIYLVTKGL